MPRIRSDHAALALLLGAIMLFVPLAAVSADVAPEPASIQQSDDPPADADRWWGAIGGVMCGIEARLVMKVPAIGFNPYVMAAGIGGCLLAAIDIMTTE